MSASLKRVGTLSCSLLALCLCHAAPARAADISAEIGAVSDYRYRGISLSDRRPAIQASILIEHESGFHGELWTSMIDGTGDRPGLELDLTAGYSIGLAEDISLEVAATYYVYPGDPASNYVEANLVAERVQGPFTARLGASLVPRQAATEDETGKKQDNVYVFAGADHQLADLPVTLSAELGYERGLFDEAPRGGKWDWLLGGEWQSRRIRIGLFYSGSSAEAGDDQITASIFVGL